MMEQEFAQNRLQHLTTIGSMTSPTCTQC